MQKIGRNVYVETKPRGANYGFVVTKEGLVMIETPMVPEDARKIRNEIAKHGTLRYLINTEPHVDHVAGNCFFDGIVVGHEGARQEIPNVSLERLKELLKEEAPEAAPLDKQFFLRPPTITMSQRLTIHLGDYTFKLINMPGHSPFQVAVYIPEERIVFTGDNVINGGMPYMLQSSPYDWVDSLKQLEKLEVDTIVPGHGGLCDRSYLPKMRFIIQAWIDAVIEAIDKGMSLKEAQEKVSLLERFPTGENREKMLTRQRLNVGRLYDVLKTRNK
jgi:cyclase